MPEHQLMSAPTWLEFNEQLEAVWGDLDAVKELSIERIDSFSTAEAIGVEARNRLVERVRRLAETAIHMEPPSAQEHFSELFHQMLLNAR